MALGLGTDVEWFDDCWLYVLFLTVGTKYARHTNDVDDDDDDDDEEEEEADADDEAGAVEAAEEEVAVASSSTSSQYRQCGALV